MDNSKTFREKIYEKFDKWFRKASNAHIIALGYLCIILAGTLLLKLPFASREKPLGVIDTLFTAVSASCVTGLVAADTYTQWSAFGDIVIICLIQIGGMGFMTLVTLAGCAAGKKLGLKERSVLRESVNDSLSPDSKKLIGRIVKGTFICEGFGALLFMTRLIPKLGIWAGIANSCFLAVSSFCNAGFDLFGRYGQYSSLSEFAADPVICVTAAALILTGGIGFTVWDDMARHRLKFSAYRLQSKLAIIVTLILTIGGTLLFFLFEMDFTGASAGIGQQFLNAFFNAVTPRTAGFNTVDTAALSPASKELTIIFMLIGGSPGSTAGGVKTVTVAVLVLTAFSGMRNSAQTTVLGRRLGGDICEKAVTVLVINLMLSLTAVAAIAAMQPALGLTDIVFEAFSAVNTVGMTTGITRELNPVSKGIIILLMYSGRVGSVSFASVFTGAKKYTGVQCPEEQINVG